MKFEIKSRLTSKVIFTAELKAKFDSESDNVKLGEAVKQAVKSRSNLRGAELSGANLSDADLRDADLRDADLRGAYLRGAYLRGADLRDADLRDADLRGAYLRGAKLRGADLRGAYLRDADLRDADLRGAYLRGAKLRGADLRGADLRDADLRGADLSGAELSGAELRGANLSDADLRGVPFIKNIHQTVYQAASVPPEALDMSTWHKCETTHCRAGWVVTLAGEAGRAMEFCIGTPAAAALIYLKSDPALEKIPNFYASNEDALADMKRLAAKEASLQKGTDNA